MIISKKWGVAAAATVLLLAGCTEDDGSDATEPSTSEGAGSTGAAEEFAEVTGDVNLVLVAPETGPLAATVGAALQAGTTAITELWNEQHPDRQVTVTVCNDEGNPERAIGCVNRYSGDADAMIGPLFGAQYNAAEELLGQQQIDVTFTPHALPDADAGIFQSATPAELAMEHTMGYFEAQGWTKLGLMTSTDTTGNTAREAGLAAAEEAGIEVVDQLFDPRSQDHTAPASALADADVDAVFVWSSGSQVVTALRGLSAAGVDLPVILNFSSMSYQLLGLAESVLPEELLFTGSLAFEADQIEDPERREMVEAFTDRYEAEAGTPPDWIAYATADIFQVALTAALHGEDVETMTRYLEEGPAINGFHAVWDYSSTDHVGVSGEGAESPIVIQRWTGEAWESVE
jgi:branched-chain amino acid transport system substrate-binding protein